MANAVEIVIKALDSTRGGFSSALKNVQGFSKAASAMGGLAVAAGAAVGTAFFAAAKSFADSADELGKMSEKTGIATETLSKLKFVADENNLSWEQMQKAFRGASIEASKSNQTFEQLLTGTADKFAGLADGAGKAAEAQRLFGKGGADLIPILNLGSDGLKKAIKDAESFTTVIDSKTAAAADQFGDNIGRIGSSLKSAFNDTIKDALPYLLSLSESILKFVKNATDAIKSSHVLSGVIEFIGKVAATTGESLLLLQAAFVGVADVATSVFIGSLDDVADATEGMESKVQESASRIKKIWTEGLKLPDVQNKGALGEVENPLDIEKWNKAYLKLSTIQWEGSMRAKQLINEEHDKRIESIKDLQVSEEAKNRFTLESARVTSEQKVKLQEMGIFQLQDIEVAKNEGDLKRLQTLLVEEEAINLARLENNRALADMYVQDWREASESIKVQLKKVDNASFDGAVRGLSTSLKGLVDGTMKWGEAWKNLANTILSSVLDAITQMIAKLLVIQGLKAVLGGGLFTRLFGFQQGGLVPNSKGFAEGGYTGAGLTNRVAGVVHAGEYVIPANVVNSFGVPLFDSIRNGILPYMGDQQQQQDSGPSIIEVHLDGEVLGRGIGRLSRDGRMVLSASAIA